MKLTREQFAQGYRLVAGHLRPPLLPARAALVGFHFRGNPPTATHHDKQLVVRSGKPRMINSAALAEAHAYYSRQLPARKAMIPLLGPVLADVSFFFELPEKPDAAGGEKPGWPCQRKPDRDNAVKVLFDELALAGYLAADEQITDGPIRKRWAVASGGGVVVLLRTIGLAQDDLIFTPEEIGDAAQAHGELLKPDKHGNAPVPPPSPVAILRAHERMKRGPK